MGALGALALWATATAIAGCTFKKNQPEHPYPSEARVAKSFFETADSDGRPRLKTFIAGWSPEMYASHIPGEVIESMVHYNHAEHLNVVFETTADESSLIARRINPSFISDGQDCLARDSEAAKACRARWPIVLSIPITKRFYYERDKDGRGRETDRYVEKSDRSHWSARPYMNLDFKSMTVREDWVSAFLRAERVEDIEWDHDGGFLGFTLEMTPNPDNEAMLGRRAQRKMRFNFLAFEHDPCFKPTPYRHENAKYLNVLHVIGKQIDGDPANTVMYAARWATKGKAKHTIWLHGFPKEYEGIGKDVIEHWNDVFAKAGHGRPFTVGISDRRYAFDLRYPTITWVADKRLSYNAPLGVGMALTDVRNGEIKWGAVTLWGGMLEEIINSYTPNGAAAGLAESAFGKPIVQMGLMEPRRKLPGLKPAVPESLTTPMSFSSVRNELIAQFGQRHAQIQMTLKTKAPATKEEKSALEQKAESIAELFKAKSQQNRRDIVDEMANGLIRLNGRMGQMSGAIGPADKIYNADYIQDLIKMPRLADSHRYIPTHDQKALQARLREQKTLGRDEIIGLITRSFEGRPGQASFCTERRLHHVADMYAYGLAQGNIDKTQALRSLIKDLLLHEVGHMLGLGHNFKENILPEPGSLPAESKALGLYKPYAQADLVAAAKDGFKNYSTVMGYKNGLTDILMKYEDLTPGPADVLSVEYIYNARYPVYPRNANGAGDLEFVNLGKDGLIVENLQKSVDGRPVTYRPAFFPACNDFTASFGSDPYCARWDRGYNATTLVQNHFESFRGNLVSTLNAFTDSVKGDAYWMSENYLWYRSLDTFSRARIFYDYMRQKYDADIKRMAQQGSESGIQNLLQFADTCKRMAAGETQVGNAYLRDLFTKKPELQDLCVANGITVGELDRLMQLPGKDFTQVDYFNSYVSASMFGGDARGSWGRIFGTWKELARVPIKISALMTLTTPYAYINYYGWLLPISRFSREDGGYHLSTLYAKEYTSAVAAGTEMNLTLGNAALDQSTTIGRTVLSMGYFLANAFWSNDVLRVGAPFIENIRNQTDFRYSFALIDVERENEDGKAIARRFTGTIYNMYSRGPEKVPELYVYTNDRVIARPPPGSLLLPLSPIRWYTKSSGYYYAIKMDYSDEFFDRLKTNSVRKTLSEAYQDVTRNCIMGVNRNGLRYFFNKDVSETLFPGFEFPESIADRSDSKNRFLLSVERQFDAYYANDKKTFNPAPDRAACEEAYRGQGLLVMAASVLNGYYFMNLYDYIEKGN